MGDDTQTFVFSAVPSGTAEEVFAFHYAIAQSDQHIWPRTREELAALAQSGSLFSSRRADSGELVGLCYVKRDHDTAEWEVGGLTVAEPARKHGIGTFLVQFALAHVMVYENPWATGQEIIAYVHEANEKPRGLLKLLSFEYITTIEISGEGAPASMARNAAGNLVGDKFRFTRKGFQALADWFANRFDGTIGTHGAQATIQLHDQATADDLIEALVDIAKDL